MIRQFHYGMMGRVMDDGALPDPFPVTNGVKQGYVLAPTLFSIVFSEMLMYAFRDLKQEFTFGSKQTVNCSICVANKLKPKY